MVLAVLVWRALARPAGAALADALPDSVAATICTSAAVVVTDVAVLARRARALYLAQRVGATLAELPVSLAAPASTSAAVVVVMLVRRALTPLMGAGLADALPAFVAALA
jgi:hypothetical protein